MIPALVVPSIHQLVDELRTARAFVDVACVATVPDNDAEICTESLYCVLRDVYARLGAVETALAHIAEGRVADLARVEARHD